MCFLSIHAEVSAFVSELQRAVACHQRILIPLCGGLVPGGPRNSEIMS